MKNITLAQARKVKEIVSNLLKNKPEVVAVGITSDPQKKYAVAIRLSTELPKDFRLPPEIDGVNLDVRIIGDVKLVELSTT